LRLIQYSLGDANLDHKDLQDNADLKQWIEFFKSAHEKDSIPQSVGEPVKKAYSMIQVDTLKKKHPDLLKTSDEFFASLTEHDQAVGVQAMEKNAREVAKRMISDAMVLEKVVKMTQLSLEVVEALAAEVSAETSGKS